MNNLLLPKKEKTFVFNGKEYEKINQNEEKDIKKKKIKKIEQISSFKELGEYLEQIFFSFIWARFPKNKTIKKVLTVLFVIIMIVLVGAKQLGIDLTPKKDTVSVELKKENEELKTVNSELRNTAIIDKVYYENSTKDLKEDHKKELSQKDNEIKDLKEELSEKDDEIINLKVQNEILKIQNDGS